MKENDEKKDSKSFEKIQPNGFLGQGAFGDVVLVKDKETELLYAMKEISKKTLVQSHSAENLKNEISIQKGLNHPNIVKLFSCFQDEEKVYLVLEYCKGGSLAQLLQKQKRISESRAFFYFLQTCIGVNYLHKQDIIHKDLKPANILIGSEGSVKICDFGLSGLGQVQENYCGTLEYMAPEMIKMVPYTKAIDIWSLGVLLFELLNGYTPFASKSKERTKRKITNVKDFQFEPHVSVPARNLIRRILVPHPRDRFTLDDIFGHPWIKLHEKAYRISIRDFLNPSKGLPLRFISPISNLNSKSTKSRLSTQGFLSLFTISSLATTHDGDFEPVNFEELASKRTIQEEKEEESCSFFQKVLSNVFCLSREKESTKYGYGSKY